jgi:cell division protein ZapA
VAGRQDEAVAIRPVGVRGSNFRNLVNSTVATSAMPIGMPGWPELAFSTASIGQGRGWRMVSVQIAGRTYELACGEGEEARVQELAAYVDGKVSELRRQLPGTPEFKLLVFASLLLAEESREARGVAKAAETARVTATDSADTLATALEELITARVDKMSKKVSGAA